MMLEQIRSYINKKNYKIVYVFVFIIIFIVVINIVHDASLKKNAILSLKQDNLSSTNCVSYSYLSKNVNNITFYFQYEKDGKITQDILGDYEVNNHFDIKNIFKGYSHDKGKIGVDLIDKDTCIYLDCSSSINASKPTTISKINLLKNTNFSNYRCRFISIKRLKNKNVYTLMEGESLKDHSKIKLYLTYE
nr:hypothetical protein [uncultured Faecalibacillus sp.]